MTYKDAADGDGGGGGGGDEESTKAKSGCDVRLSSLMNENRRCFTCYPTILLLRPRNRTG